MPASRSRPSGSVMALTADTRRATWPSGCSAAIDRPTAIFTASDTQALGVIAAARELGLHVPDDLSVIGYDDIEAADYVGLTTIRQQLSSPGAVAPRCSLREIDDRSEEPPVVHLAPELVVRATTAPSEGGPWMTTARRRGEPARETDGGGVFMISNAIKRANGGAFGRTYRRVGGRSRRLVAACAAPGTTTAPSAACYRRARHDRPIGQCAQRGAVRERGRGRAIVRNGPGGPQRLLRDGLRSPVQALRGVHQAVPERDLEDHAGPVHEPDDRDAAAPVRRQSAGSHPAAVDGLARQGRAAQEPRRLRHGVRLGQVARRAARPEPRRDRRDPRFGLALCHGPQLQPDRRLLQQEARRSRSA